MQYLMRWLDATTMYRVVMYALGGITFAALTLSAAGVLAVSPLEFVASFVVIAAAAGFVHYTLTWLTKAPSNIESTGITVLILFLVLQPASGVPEAAYLALLAALAIAAKYVIRFRYRHVFNPAALVFFVAPFLGFYGVSWWVGSRYLFPVVLIAALLVVAKTRRWELFLTYVLASTFIVLVMFWGTAPVLDILSRHFFSWPTIFFAAFMLTEPLGIPSRWNYQYGYALTAAAVASIPFSFGPIYGTPELALLVANLMTLVVDRPERLRLTLKHVHEVGKGTFEYVFGTAHPQHHVPGQYLEWTLPHPKPDLRGIRRYFTIASAPGGREVSFAVRHGEKQSSWKQTLETLPLGATLYATQCAGDFTLAPEAPHYVWIAGGIGVTPFVSQVRTAINKGEKLSATLFYCNRSEADIAFKPLFDEAQAIGVSVVHVLQEPATSGFPFETGFITREMILKYVPEWKTATFYISGPPGLVGAYQKLLREMGVPKRRMVTDYFPGLA